MDETNKLIMEKTERINYLEQMLNEQVPELVKESVEEHIEENIGESNDKILGMNSGIKEQIHSKITEKIKLLKQYNWNSRCEAGIGNLLYEKAYTWTKQNSDRHDITLKKELESCFK